MGDALDGIRLRCGDVLLRPASDADVVRAAAVLANDYELDPTVVVPGERLSRPAHLLRTVQRDRAARRPGSWTLHLLASAPDGRPIGMQTMEAEAFTVRRTVDSASWVAAADRGRGVGRAMRAAMLALAFDGLGARRAITSAWWDNLPSLAVSARLGYVVDRTERRPRGEAEDDLVHLHLDAAAWRAGPRPEVTVAGVTEAALADLG